MDGTFDSTPAAHAAGTERRTAMTLPVIVNAIAQALNHACALPAERAADVSLFRAAVQAAVAEMAAGCPHAAGGDDAAWLYHQARHATGGAQ